MLVREVRFPTPADDLWEALTDPATVSAWFGAQVEWDLRPGGRARFVGGDGSVRLGQVEEVVPGRRLQFRWWPEEGGQGGRSSTVSYDLDNDEDGTRLTVIELPDRVAIEAPARDVPSPEASEATAPRDWDGPQACVRAGATPAEPVVTWTEWDARLLWCWARSQTRVGVLA